MSTLLNPRARSSKAGSTAEDDLPSNLRDEARAERPVHLERRSLTQAEDELMETSDLAEVLDAFECGGGVGLSVEVVNAPERRPEPEADDEREAFRVTWWKRKWASPAFYTIGQPPRARGL